MELHAWWLSQIWTTPWLASFPPCFGFPSSIIPCMSAFLVAKVFGCKFFCVVCCFCHSFGFPFCFSVVDEMGILYFRANWQNWEVGWNLKLLCHNFASVLFLYLVRRDCRLLGLLVCPLHQCILLWFCESGISGMLPLCDCNGCNLTRTQKLRFLLYLQFIMNIQPWFQ